MFVFWVVGFLVSMSLVVAVGLLVGFRAGFFRFGDGGVGGRGRVAGCGWWV